MVAGRVDVVGDGWARKRDYPAPAYGTDEDLLRAMRTKGHSPGSGEAAKALGKAGNNGAIWVVPLVVLAATDSNREAWFICALLAPIAIALNYVIKLIVKRPRPVLEGLPPLGGAPSSLSFPSAHATSSFAVATAMTRVDAGGHSRLSWPLPSRSAVPTLGCTTRPMSSPAPCSASPWA